MSSLFLFAFVVGGASALTGSLDDYLTEAVAHANEKIENAITTPSGVGGTTAASENNIAGNIEAALSTGVGGTPDDWCPNYQYSWLRDQALVMTTVMNKYEAEPAGTTNSLKYQEILQAYAAQANTVYDMNDNPLWFTDEGRPWSHAEAKYELWGQMYTGGWCSPQNDGPALRSVVLMRFANRYAEVNPTDSTYVSQNLYSNSTEVGVKNPIKRDLEFLYQKPQLVATNPDRYTGYWDSDNCEPWEEISGKHFYNRLMARRAMVRGADFAAAQGDGDAAASYASAVDDVTSAVNTHWNPSLKTIMPSNNENRYDDVQTVFASLHSYAQDDDFYAPSDSKALANAYYTLNSFADYFNLNKIGYDTEAPLSLGLAVGRYTGDVYNGGCNYDDSVCPYPCGGQPWVLATTAMAELIYKAVDQWTSAAISIDDTNKNFFEFFNIQYDIGSYDVGSIEHSQMLTVLIHAADSFFERVQYHTAEDYRLDEQYNADTGVMMSAGDLVWSYASLVTASDARAAVGPAATIAGLPVNSGATVLQEFIISDYDVPKDDSLPVLRIVGNTESLGALQPCRGDFAERTPTVRRCSKNASTGASACDYTLLVNVPKGISVEWRVVRTDESCSVFELSSATSSTTIAADNYGYAVTSASWTK